MPGATNALPLGATVEQALCCQATQVWRERPRAGGCLCRPPPFSGLPPPSVHSCLTGLGLAAAPWLPSGPPAFLPG